MADSSVSVVLPDGCTLPPRSVYLSFLAESFGRVSLNLFADGAQSTAPIDQVYVSPCFRPASRSAAERGPMNRSQLHGSLVGECRWYQWEGVIRWYPDPHVIPSVDRLLETYPRLIVSGEVGTGKSTLLAYMTWKAAVGNGPGLPLYFSLRGGGPDGCLPLPAQPPGWSERLAGSFFQRLLEQETCLLVFDGLDEVAPAVRERTVAQIEALAGRYPGHGFALTTRPDALPGTDRLSGFGRVAIEPLDAPRLERWTRRFYRASGAGLRETREAQRFVEALRDSDSAFSGALSPLLLKALAQLQREGLDLHGALDGLCHRCLRLLLEEWDAGKGIASFFLLDYKLRVLQPIALQLLRAGREDAPIAEVEATARRRVTELGLRPEYVLPLLDEIARRNGLLVSRRPGWLGFFFGWLQRYLAARELREQADGAEELLDHLGDADWERTSMFYANLGDATYLVGLLLGADDPFQRHLLLAGRCAAVAPALAAHLREQIVETLIQLSRVSPFEPVASRACKILAQIGGEAARAHLRALLTGDDEDRRRQTLAVLTSAPTEPLADLLGKTFHVSSSPSARALAVGERLVMAEELADFLSVYQTDAEGMRILFAGADAASGAGELLRVYGAGSGRVQLVRAALNGGRIRARLEGMEPSARTPASFALHANAPNPFNPETAIRFDLPTDAQVRLEVFDALGQRVRILVGARLPAEAHRVTWDGRDAAGSPVGSGVYFYRLQARDGAASFAQMRRMVLLK